MRNNVLQESTLVDGLYQQRLMTDGVLGETLSWPWLIRCIIMDLWEMGS